MKALKIIFESFESFLKKIYTKFVTLPTLSHKNLTKFTKNPSDSTNLACSIPAFPRISSSRNL